MALLDNPRINRFGRQWLAIPSGEADLVDARGTTLLTDRRLGSSLTHHVSEVVDPL